MTVTKVGRNKLRFRSPLPGIKTPFLEEVKRLWAKGIRKGFRVQGLGFRVQGLGFRVQGLGFRVSVFGCRV